MTPDGGQHLSEPAFRRVAVVGAGLMGRGIGVEFALSGAEVSLLCSRWESTCAARDKALDELDWLARASGLSAQAARGAAKRLRAARDLADAVCDAELVVESVPEDLETKQALFERLDRLTDSQVPLASNTSSLPITEVAARALYPERVLGMHYWNPPYLMPLVEIVAGQRTAEHVLAQVERALRRLGKETVRVRKEVPGFLWNRLQSALLREALWLVEQGVATPEDVDLAVRKGLGRRYSAIGLFEAVDLGGLATWHGVARRLFPVLSAQAEPGPLLRRALEQGRRGAESGAGIYEWPPKRLAAVKARRDSLLVDWLARDREERAASVTGET